MRAAALTDRISTRVLSLCANTPYAYTPTIARPDQLKLAALCVSIHSPQAGQRTREICAQFWAAGRECLYWNGRIDKECDPAIG